MKLLNTSYIRSDRSIEIIQIENLKDNPICFVYNFEGIHYRFFKDIVSLLNFFKFGKEPKHDFETETALDNFLQNLSFNELV